MQEWNKHGAKIGSTADDDRTLCLGVIHDDLATGGKTDLARARVFDAVDVCGQGRVYIGFFKRKIASDHFAVDQREICAVAQRLCSDDLTVIERESVGIPRQVLTLHDAVSDSDIFRVPKGILRVEIAVFEHCIRDILEGIFPFECKVLEITSFCCSLVSLVKLTA